LEFKRMSTEQVLSGYITEADFAEAVSRSVRQIQNWRRQRVGPPPTYIGRCPYYRLEAIHAWLLSREIAPDSKPRRRRAS
jgi:hypothetical protein